MKKFNIILAFVLGFAAMAFTSCQSDEDNNPVFQKPTAFVLNTPKYASGLYDLQNTETLQLTCSQPDYGYAAAAVYTVEVSTQNDFAPETTQVLPTTYTTCKMDINANELAIALCSAYGVIDEATVPAEPIKAYIRLVADLKNVGEDARITSNVIELPQVQLYYALPDVELPEKMYMIGDFCGWSWGDAAKMAIENASNNQWWCIRYIGEGKGFKFNYDKEWNGNEVGFAGVVAGEKGTAAGALVDAGGNIGVEKGGWYIIAVTVDIVGRDYVYTVDMFEPKVYIFGATNGGIWNADDAWMFTVPETEDGEFVSPALAAEGEVRMCIAPKWGGDWWSHEFTLKNDGTIVYREKDNIADSWEKDKGAEYSVQGAPGKVIKLNFNTGKGKIE